MRNGIVTDHCLHKQETAGFYNFSNIRYAAPPLGELRFTKPEKPAVNRSVVNTGSYGPICPQANPAWEAIAAEWIPLYLSGNQTTFNESQFATSSNSTALPAQDPRTNEDCLFLDVFVPQSVFENRGGYGAPVAVWIYGGGYTAGSKVSSGSPAGLLARSEGAQESGLIYVAMNYRLGAFGWLAGPTFQTNGTANAGLYDQRLALEWVQENIHLFGGDPNRYCFFIKCYCCANREFRVTVFGESAGGGSIMHQVTSFGGKEGSVPFQQAIPQSPGFLPIGSPIQEEATFNAYLALLNVSTIEEARQLPYTALQTANIIQVGSSSYGGFTYGPVVDGNFVPDLPGQLLARGQYDTSLRLMLGHNADEGLLFTSPFIANNSDFRALVTTQFPTLNVYSSIVDYIVNTLYPPIFDGSQAMGYRDQIGRAAAMISEVSFTCNTFYLDKAFANDTFSYLFAIPPALHGEDVPYTYYPSAGVEVPAIAIALQEYITRFAETGNPNVQGVPYFDLYSANATVQVLNITGISEIRDPAANARCDWWQKGLIF